ncbi:ATP-binding protein [Arcobacter sp. LA11]|uniref:ATP-binding protein n=1 Tax=Arcobacter sp. LA11 TaxID=1898176 RepID=UPI0009350B2C|nr:ATP-binding protein [Arcobacter sp. LA11]
MFFNRDTIFGKIFKVLFLAIISFSTIFAVYFISNQKDQILRSLKLEAHSIAKMLTYASSDAIVLDDGAFLVEFNYEFMKENDSLKALIISKLDKTSYIIRKDGWAFENKIDKIFLNGEKKEVTSRIILSPISNENIFHYVFPIEFSGTHWGWLHLNMSLDNYNKKISNMYLEFFTFFIILLLLSMIVSYIVAKNFSNPIIRLNKVANRISRGHLELRSDYKSSDEIGQLSDSFNKMISKIEESQAELRTSHEDLEQRVKERTLELYEANRKLQDNSVELEELNINLDKKVKDEVEKRTKQEGLLIQQSRLAAMGEMLGNIAHQWRQPLSVVTTAATGIKVEKEFGLSNEKAEVEKLDTIIKTSNFLSNTIEDFSNFFKPNKNKVDFSIEERVEQSLELVSASLNFNHICVKREYSEIDKVYGFPNEYSQAILNILTNAKDVIVENRIKEPLIKIKTYKKNKKGYLEIEDNAGGIKSKVLEKIFDPYFTTKHQSQGTGIGLYMSKMIIEQNMNGKLEAKNGKNGAIFIISIPII